MAEVSWTPAQKEAIDARGRTLLVSAAAGSGKTAVLTERIIEKLKSGEGDLRRMLIVTFTRAAAKELKSRITLKLSDALAADPTNSRLATQLSFVAAARICTIDSFCIDIVKHNFDKLGLPCGIRVADTAEIELLKAKLMDAMFDDLYEDGSAITEFRRFTDCFIADKDDELPAHFLKLYNDLSTMTEGVGLVRRFAEQLEAEAKLPFFQGKHGSYLREYTKAFTECFLPAAAEMQRLFSDCPEGDRNYRYFTEYSRIVNELKAINTALENNDYNGVKAILSSSAPISMAGSKLTDYPEAELIRGVRNEYNERVKSLYTEFYCDSEQQIKNCFKDTEQVYRSLYNLLSQFDKKLKNEKLKRKLMDFNDAERYALQLLCENGNPTESAKNIGTLFDEIYIDEYQDINQLQDTIFTMISGNAERFMVGDIKQSIYGFRGSEPSIFADYRDRFPAYDKLKDDTTGTIFLSNNFRCSKPVVDFCNSIFGKMMGKAFGGVAYMKEDDLIYSKSEQTPVNSPVEVIIADKGCPQTEAEIVAERINELLKEGHTADDIVILLRSPKNKAAEYEKALGNLKIPCFNAAESDFFANPEIMLMLCLLNTIDNPRRDIYLAGALQSPIFGFTLDDMVEIRNFCHKGYLYDALCEWYKETASPKGKFFFELIDELRKYAAKCPIDKLIWYIYTRTSLTAMVYDGETGKRRANLIMLYEYARTYENGSFKGLYNFIRYIDSLIQNSTRIKEAKTDSSSSPTVKIMSIHNSKGLEFPVCFLCECDSPYSNYNSQSKKDTLICDSALGIAVYTPEQTGLCKVNGILRRIIKLKKQNDEAAEEMRLLYVALTRARDRLVVSATSKSVKKLYEKCTVLNRIISPFSVINTRNYITLIQTALLNEDSAPFWSLSIVGEDGIPVSANVPLPTEQNTAEGAEPSYEECVKVINERFSFVYPHGASAMLPSKMAVSGLYPGVLDEEDLPALTAPMRALPRFMEPAQKADGAARGTATHVFMQFCDFDSVVRNGVDEEIERLIAKKFIPENYRDMIHRKKVENFFRSPLFKEMASATLLQREMRFNICLSAAELTESEELKGKLEKETVLVQGVIDCFFTDTEGRVTIVDYKTDYFTEQQKKDPLLCEQILRQRHKQQLEYYKAACAKLLSKQPHKTVIYSFDLDRAVEV